MVEDTQFSREIVWFKFDVGSEQPRAVYPDEPLWRPVLSTQLSSGRGPPVSTRLLVDSGSEYTLVTRAFARRLGILDVLSADNSDEIRIGAMTLEAEFAEIDLGVANFEPYSAMVGFVDNWTFSHAGILGQRGFFDQFGVLFDRANLRFGVARLQLMDETFGTPLAPADFPKEGFRP